MTATVHTPVPGEPGSPLLVVTDGEVERFADAEALARRVHQLRQGGGLDCTEAHASTGGPAFPGVLVWRAARETTPRLCLAFAAGPDVRTPDQLLAVLKRTAAKRAA